MTARAYCPHCGVPLDPRYGFNCAGKVVQQGFFPCMCGLGPDNSPPYFDIQESEDGMSLTITPAKRTQ